MSTHRTRRTPQRPEDQASNWFLTLEIAEARGDIEAATEARRELERLGWRVTRPYDPPRSDGDDDPDAWFSALLRARERNDERLVDEALEHLNRLGYIVVPIPPKGSDRKGVE